MMKHIVGQCRSPFAGVPVGLLLAFVVAGCGGSTATSNPSDGGSGGRSTVDAAAGSGGSGGPGGASAGTGGASAGSGGRLGTGGAGTGGSTASGGAGGGSVPVCKIMLSFGPVPEAGAGAMVRVRGTLTSPGPKTPPSWRWRVVFEDGRDLTPGPVPVEDDGQTVEFEVRRPGRYDIKPMVDTGVSCSVPLGEKDFINVQASCPGCFRFRVTPPNADDVSVPLQESDRLDVLEAQDLILAPGMPIKVRPLDDRGRFLPAYVRISEAASGLAIEGHTASGDVDVNWPAGRPFEILVIPIADIAIAPQVFTGLNPSGIFKVDNGTFVTGNAVDGQGTAVPRAKVLLRAGARPSTIGDVDPRGNFSLSARPGVLSAVIVPPPETGLPEANVPASPGIVLDGAGRYLKIEWAPVTRSALALTVTSQTDAPVPNARVRVESLAEAGAVARMDVYAAEGAPAPVQTLVASGFVRIDAVSDGTGIARFPAVPSGGYRVTIAPPAGSTAGVLTTTIITKAAEDQAAVVALMGAVTANGVLTAPTAPEIVAGARVYARDTGGGVVADESVATTDTSGRFSLRLAPNRTYRLVAEHPKLLFARTPLGPPVAIGANAVQTLTTIPIRRGRAFRMNARGAGPLGGIIVHVFCVASSASCLDPSQPIAETVTGADGSFTVVLPDPGS